MEAHCSFYTLVGGLCAYNRRDRKHTTEIVPLLTCAKDISSHKSLWGFQDVDNEVDLIIARAAHQYLNAPKTSIHLVFALSTALYPWN
jgi:hypothetical protein